MKDGVLEIIVPFPQEKQPRRLDIADFTRHSGAPRSCARNFRGSLRAKRLRCVPQPADQAELTRRE
jgi:hypothetical protein